MNGFFNFDFNISWVLPFPTKKHAGEKIFKAQGSKPFLHEPRLHWAPFSSTCHNFFENSCIFQWELVFMIRDKLNIAYYDVLHPWVYWQWSPIVHAYLFEWVGNANPRNAHRSFKLWSIWQVWHGPAGMVLWLGWAWVLFVNLKILDSRVFNLWSLIYPHSIGVSAMVSSGLATAWENSSIIRGRFRRPLPWLQWPAIPFDTAADKGDEDDQIERHTVSTKALELNADALLGHAAILQLGVHWYPWFAGWGLVSSKNSTSMYTLILTDHSEHAGTDQPPTMDMV